MKYISQLLIHSMIGLHLLTRLVNRRGECFLLQDLTQEFVAAEGHTGHTGLPHDFIRSSDGPGSVSSFDNLADLDTMVYDQIRFSSE